MQQIFQHSRFYVVNMVNKIFTFFNFMGYRVYNLHDSLFIKNIRNNLLNPKWFVFPLLDFIKFEYSIHVETGKICRRLLHNV